MNENGKNLNLKAMIVKTGIPQWKIASLVTASGVDMSEQRLVHIINPSDNRKPPTDEEKYALAKILKCEVNDIFSD